MKITLINMPFSNLSMPSLALTQIASVVKDRFAGSVDVDTAYLNMEFANYFDDIQHYQHVTNGGGFMTGIGEWFFRQSAFPDEPDNSDEYFDRFYFQDDEKTKEIRQAFASKREGLDAFMDSLIERYDIASADIVGFTALFSQTVASFAMARRLKMIKPDIIICMGGAACEGVMGLEFARHIDNIDYIFSGPALIGFPALVQHLQDGEENACESIDGVFTKSNTAENNSPELLGADLDINKNIELDYKPFLDAFEYAFQNGELHPVLLLETSRGCYWAEKMVCTFCGLNGLQRCYRQMSPANALIQLDSLRKWVPRCASFIAVDTAMPRNYVTEVFPTLNADSGMKLMYEVRPDLKEEELEIMTKAGIKALQPGIESLSSDSLKLMRKGTTAFRNINFLKACSHHPIALDWNLLIFSPGEDEAVLKKYLTDIPLLYHLAPPTGVYPIMFVRHSLYFDEPETYGLDLYPQDFYKLTYPFDKSTIDKIANYFLDRNADDTARMEQWLVDLNIAVANWRERWLGNNDNAGARLCFFDEEDSNSVYDTRSGEVVEHQLTESAKRILTMLEQPGSKDEVAAGLDDLSEEEIEETVKLLKTRGLLFEENGRYLSLIAV